MLVKIFFLNYSVVLLSDTFLIFNLKIPHTVGFDLQFGAGG